MEPITYTLDANGEVTDWLDIEPAVDDFGFHITISGTLTVIAEVSNLKNGSATKDDAYTVETFTASAAKQWAQPLPRLVRFRCSAYTSGSAVISIWPIDTPQGLRQTVGEESVRVN